MGGFFGGGSPAPTYTPPPPPPQPAPAADPEDQARKQREDAMMRNRRGRAGMVATSDRGVLAPVASTTKSLLGE